MRISDWSSDVCSSDLTRLADTAKPSLEAVVIASPAGDLSARWGRYSAVADGVALTQTLVAEPPNLLYPETFVERCQHLTDLGRSEEHTSELQSLMRISYAVFCLKKKKNTTENPQKN